MSLTSAQLNTLKTDILANTDPAVVQGLIDGNNGVIAAWYNENASPDYYVWRSSVTQKEVGDAIRLVDIGNITATDKDRVLAFFALRPDGFDGSDADTRSAFDDAFSTAAGDNSQQALIPLWKRLATNTEKLFAAGGAGTELDPATMAFEGSVSSSDISQALNI